MSTSESTSDGKAQEPLPDLYRLLGLAPLEADATKIQRGLLAMQKKGEAVQNSDPKLAQRAAKIVALGKKTLLDADRKSAYDRAWTKAFGVPNAAGATITKPSVTTTQVAASPVEALPEAIPVAVVAQAVAAKAVEHVASKTEPQARSQSQEPEASTSELEWDLEELESLLPSEDPRAPFDLGGFLRYSVTLPETNPIADYDKLQSFLGGTATATMTSPASISAAELMPEYSRLKGPLETEESADTDDSLAEQFAAPKIAAAKRTSAAARPPVLPTASGGIAQQIRRKRSQAMLLTVGGIAGALVLVFGIMFYLVMQGSGDKVETTELAQALREKTKPAAEATAAAQATEPNMTAPVQGSGLPKVGGLDGNIASEQPNPNMMEDMTKDPASSLAAPSPNAPSPPASNNAAVPSLPAESLPAESMATKPESESAPEAQPATPAPEVVLTAAEKMAWSKSMKELLKTIGAQNFKLAKEQVTASESLAKTAIQKEQLKRLGTVAKLAEEYHQFLVDAVTSLGPAETFKIGGSSEASFIEGNETAVSLKIRGRATTFAFTELQIGVANGLVDLKMDREHPTSLARKAAFALVHPKSNNLALKAAREQMIAAAAAGAVETDLPNVFDDDYSLK